MADHDYRRALEAATREYEELGAKRREIDQRLAQLSQSIATLTRLLGLTPTVPFGLTDAIRMIVRGTGVPMTPVEVRDRLHAMGFDVSKYANDLAAVHTILKRLNESGEIRFLARAGGSHQYIWNTGVTSVVLTKDVIQYMHENTMEREAARATDIDPAPPSAKASGGRPSRSRKGNRR